MNPMTHSLLMTQLVRRIAAPALCVAAALLGGCAITPSTTASLVPTTTLDASGTKHAQSVTVAVGGVSSHEVAKRHLSDDTVAEALVAAIDKNKSFSRVVKGAGANYQLNVNLLTADYPAMGLNFTVKTEMTWSLKRADGTAVWQESIRSEGLATTSDAFAGAERVRLAAERAVRENINQGLIKISKLKL